MTLRVGDRVRFKENYNSEKGPRYVRQASTGTVRRTRESFSGDLLLTVDVDEGPRGVTVYDFRVEKIEDPAPKFKAGDRALDSFSKEVVTITALDAHSAWPIQARYKDGGLGLWRESELTKIESGVPFKPEHGDKVVNLKTGREGVVLMGQVWDKDIFSKARPVPVSALVEYEEHHAGTYDLIKKDVPW